ncbi:3'-5' RNA helicase YTHDC2-like [Anopheles darlingi]|uniref:3'-5' RNA helicase YTHDC2-like n=1 Tax=Anopheles darlingi TaxID=43151 RepID=UPI0021004AE2|nr:3'-5' RNA helicase YTHDC2-like [Anopheles darlingi]
MVDDTISAITLMIQRDIREKSVLIEYEVDRTTLQSLQVRFASEDAFKNVRCLQRKDGKLEIHRVDNGGCLEFGTKTEKLLGPMQCEQKQPVNERFIRNETAFDFCNINLLLENTTQAHGAVPPASGEDAATALQRAQLPISCCRNDILSWLAGADPVAIVTGAIDVNRSVQTIQYILEDCSTGNKVCRGLCVLSSEQEVAIIVKQICQERKEQIGKAVGYDVTFSHQLSEITNIVICSTQTFLAHLMAPNGKTFFGMLTHLILDDVGHVAIVESLLALGANPYLKGKCQSELVHWCFTQADAACLSIINKHYDQYRSQPVEWRYEYAFLWMYQRLHNPYAVDNQLVVNIVQHIYENLPGGIILIMMPEFTDIMGCYDLLLKTTRLNLPTNSFVLLHRFVAEDEIALEVERIGAAAFQIILLEDCMFGAMPKVGNIHYVIDTGLTAYRAYNASDGSYNPHSRQLITTKTAKVRSAIAQRGCFHLYSIQQEMCCMNEKEQKSRNCPPMSELLLKFLLCQSSSSDVSFLERALPGTLDLKIPGFLEHLQQIGAICTRDLAPTNLGLLLANLCNSAVLGKALLYAIMFRCIDPVLTIVASVLVGDPFIEPRNETECKRIASIKAACDRHSLSDFYVLLRLFQDWNAAKVALDDGSMIEQYCLKLGAMEAISNLRTRLMSHLRALNIVTVGRSVNVHQLNERSSQWSTIKGCLAAGLYPNLVKMDYEKMALVSCGEPDPLELHPASVVKVKELASHWIIGTDVRC